MTENDMEGGIWRGRERQFRNLTRRQFYNSFMSYAFKCRLAHLNLIIITGENMVYITDD